KHLHLCLFSSNIFFHHHHIRPHINFNQIGLSLLPASPPFPPFIHYHQDLPSIMAASTSSTTAVNGSADEFAPSSASPPPRTPDQVEEDAALATRRCEAFMDDTLLPILTAQYTESYASTAPSRIQEAAANIDAFDAAFDKGNNEGSDDHGGNK
ncbi:hypothetical protein BKA61DRAFT_700442, partial [Leptodontidium sp. MPI-SDFR-AT-0119]